MTEVLMLHAFTHHNIMSPLLWVRHYKNNVMYDIGSLLCRLLLIVKCSSNFSKYMDMLFN